MGHAPCSDTSSSILVRGEACPGRATIERWFTVAPTESQLRADLAVLNESCSSDGHLADEFDADCAQSLIAYCQDLADASGSVGP
jgi:hypothetical protein